MRAPLAVLLGLGTACGPRAAPTTPGTPPWTGRLVPDGGRAGETVRAVASTPGQVWVVTAPRPEGGAALWRLDGDGPPVEQARARSADGWLPLPGHHAVAALQGPEGEGPVDCLLLEYDDEGREVRSTRLWQRPAYGRSIPRPPDHDADSCALTSLVAVDGGLLVALPAGVPPPLGLVREPDRESAPLLVRLGADREVLWHRPLAVDGAAVHAPVLAVGRSRVLVVMGVEARTPAELPVTLGPAQATVPASAYGGAVLALGIDADTGASLWLNVLATDGARVAHGQLLAAGSAGGLALAVPVVLAGRLAGVEVNGQAVVLALDEDTGVIAARRTLAVEPCPVSLSAGAGDGVFAPPLELRGLAVDEQGAMLAGGGLRGSLRADGVDVVRTPCDQHAARAPSPSPAPSLLAMPPPPYRPPPPPSYGFVVRLAPPAVTAKAVSASPVSR